MAFKRKIALFLASSFVVATALSLTACTSSNNNNNNNSLHTSTIKDGENDDVGSSFDISQNDNEAQNIEEDYSPSLTEAVKESGFGDKILRQKRDYSNAKSATIMIYLCGTDLESRIGAASDDIKEMLKASINSNVNVIIQTIGTNKWHSNNISGKTAQRYEIKNGVLRLVEDDLGELNAGNPKSLSDFIKWGEKNYKADRYELLIWDHGFGPVYGVGFDEKTNDKLFSNELQLALSEGGVFFDFIGFDTCLMGALETCVALYDYCDYVIASETSESQIGWNYTPFLSNFTPNIKTQEIGKIIIDSMVEANEKSIRNPEAILSLIDQSMIKILFTAWLNFAYENTEDLLAMNYSQEVDSESLGRWNQKSIDKYNVADHYYITDIMALSQNVESEASKALASALKEAIIYVNKSKDVKTFTGLSVTLPYGNKKFYEDLVKVFTSCGIESEYIKWLSQFTDVALSNAFDYSSWSDIWSGWDSFYDTFNWDSWSLFDNYNIWDEYDWEDYDAYSYYGDNYQDYYGDDDWGSYIDSLFDSIWSGSFFDDFWSDDYYYDYNHNYDNYHNDDFWSWDYNNDYGLGSLFSLFGI